MKIKSVELMRDIRHQISLDIQGMAWREEQDYLASQIKAFESLTKPPPNTMLIAAASPDPTIQPPNDKWQTST